MSCITPIRNGTPGKQLSDLLVTAPYAAAWGAWPCVWIFDHICAYRRRRPPAVTAGPSRRRIGIASIGMNRWASGPIVSA